jgi:putative transposase
MPRPRRQCTGGMVYHVLNRANGRLHIFKGRKDFDAFEGILGEVMARVPIRLCGYCLMSNHWHLLLWPHNDGDVSQFIRLLTVTHTQRWHASHGTAGIGHVYQGRFKSFPVQGDAHYLKTLAYIEGNALRADLVSDAVDWPYSSLAVRSGLQKEGIVLSPGPVALPEAWAGYVNRAPDQATRQRLENSIKRGTPFGSETWTRLTAVKTGLEMTLRPRGRPFNAPAPLILPKDRK